MRRAGDTGRQGAGRGIRDECRSTAARREAELAVAEDGPRLRRGLAGQRGANGPRGAAVPVSQAGLKLPQRPRLRSARRC